MSGGAEISSATMSCLCPPDCCSPEVEKEENYIWFLIKVLYGQWIVMGSLALPIIARLSYLEEELALVCLITFLLLLLSLPLLFGNHTHQEPACYCNAKKETSDTSEDDAEDDDAKKKKKKAKSSSSEDEDAKEKNAYKLLKKRKKKKEGRKISVSSENEDEDEKKSSS